MPSRILTGANMQRLANHVQRNNPPFGTPPAGEFGSAVYGETPVRNMGGLTGQGTLRDARIMGMNPPVGFSGGGRPTHGGGGYRPSRGGGDGVATAAMLGAQARQRAAAEEGDIATWEADMALQEARARSRSYGGGGRRPVGGGGHRSYYSGRNRWVSGSGAGGLAAANIRAAANARRQASQTNLRSNLGLASLQGYLASS